MKIYCVQMQRGWTKLVNNEKKIYKAALRKKYFFFSAAIYFTFKYCLAYDLEIMLIKFHIVSSFPFSTIKGLVRLPH